MLVVFDHPQGLPYSDSSQSSVMTYSVCGKYRVNYPAARVTSCRFPYWVQLIVCYQYQNHCWLPSCVHCVSHWQIYMYHILYCLALRSSSGFSIVGLLQHDSWAVLLNVSVVVAPIGRGTLLCGVWQTSCLAASFYLYTHCSPINQLLLLV